MCLRYCFSLFMLVCTTSVSVADIALAVRKDLGVISAFELAGASLCFGPKPELNDKVSNFFKQYEMPVVAVFAQDEFEHFYEGHCDVLAGEQTVLEEWVGEVEHGGDFTILEDFEE